MKTYYQSTTTNEECEESTGKESFLSYCYALLLQLVQSATHLRSVCRGWIAGFSNSISVAYREVTTNNRLFVGVVFLFGLAPLCWLGPYLSIFSDSVFEGWYYKKIAFYLYTIRFNLVLIFAFTGAFIAAPLKWNYKYGCVVVVALALASLINDSFFIDDYTDFYKARLIVIIPLVVVVLYSLYKFINYAVYRTYHTKDGNTARIIGIIEMDSSWSDKEKTLKILAKEYRDFNARV